MPADPLKAETLSKLTVPQLKAICKDKKITAYSKLQKATIIQKILDHAGGEQTYPMKPASILQDASRRTSSSTTEVPAGGLATDSDVSQATFQKHTKVHIPMIAQKDFPHSVNDFGATCHPTPTPPTAPLGPLRSPYRISLEHPAPKRKAEIEPPNTNVRKKKTMNAINSPHMTGRSRGPQPSTSSAPPSHHAVYFPSLLESGPGSSGRSVLVAHLPSPAAPETLTMLPSRIVRSISPLHNDSAGQTQTMKTRKRFVPLVAKKTEKSTSIQQDAISQGPLAAEVVNMPPCTCALDFDNPPLLQLLPVSMPPSLSQRKHVLRFSLAFYFVSPLDLKSLAQCSRLFRYAVYISGAQRLIRDFYGHRLTLVMKQYSQNTINMWPYLAARQKECITRKHTFLTSFLGKASDGKSLISNRLWTSPDNSKQATIAARFLLTRLFFQVSIGLTKETIFTIVDVQEVVEGEIWSVETHSSCGKEILYVLEATCEVIGHPAPRLEEGNAPRNTIPIPLRADWSAYVHQHLTRSSCLPPLLEHLKWANSEEYYRGISKLWLSRTEAEGKIGAAKRIVAERYVLACVVGNSISGRRMSSTEMAQESNGLPSQIQRPSREDIRLHLFLPAHHHVESVHFTSSDGKPLHSAVAIVQTPAREYFILKDNGMQIGCEEDGVAHVWMQILRCDAGGRAR
ncbi:hypothetical protein H2248_007609 [Termitomyces sp. 'cryptogamus']|nr:hypothetical protein H2248_007609 [Termitomyces sp. 'cryptogamus']